jgi:glucosamine--fructose-6-phosphate aminotransferase (isomerizing)
MCGIIGYIGGNNSIDIILDGLKRLEYRGYDSAGVAYLDENSEIEIVRCTGKINGLVCKFEGKFTGKNYKSTMGIGHTRWATHGSPTEENAHPHRSGPIALVHNGIIENYMELKARLLAEGFVFTSDTDSEVICHFIHSLFRKGASFEDAVRGAIEVLHGSFAIAVINSAEPDRIICAKKDSPLVIGLGRNEYFAASDVPAFLNYTRDVLYLEDGEIAILGREGATVLAADGAPAGRHPTVITWSPSMAEKGGYRHFMLKEIFEQPRAIADTIGGRVNVARGEVNLYEFGLERRDVKNIKKIFITACGTSWHASLCAKYMIEELAGIPVEVDIASEFRYRKPLIGKGDLLVSLTQSGETADTLAAMREAKRAGASTLTVCNVVGSTASREADHVFYTHSGPEIGVASTKAFTTQLVSMYLLAAALAGSMNGSTSGSMSDSTSGSTYDSKADSTSGSMSGVSAKTLIDDLLHIPALVEQVLLNDREIETLSKALSKTSDFLFLGRGALYPIALEGALKLKEISYIHAEGYPAGEMKHGPIALINDDLPVVILLSKGELYDKTVSNIQEVKSRGGRTLVVSNHDDARIRSLADHFLYVPPSNKFLNPIIMTVPLQLLAYHIAVIRGCDVDQPRNLAKSVTVE